jgi:aminoglycoside phosphotransferase (APT) family kinase protein
MMNLIPMMWDGFQRRYDAELTAEVREAGSQLVDHLAGYVLAETSPWTVVHGDYRLDNLLFADGPGAPPVAVVDWQTVTHGPGVQDVSYFIGAGLLPDARREVERDLVRSYHEGLLAAGVEGYGWEACWYEYRRQTWAGLVMAIVASMLVERTERGDRMFMAMATRHAGHALDHDAGALLAG